MLNQHRAVFGQVRQRDLCLDGRSRSSIIQPLLRSHQPRILLTSRSGTDNYRTGRLWSRQQVGQTGEACDALLELMIGRADGQGTPLVAQASRWRVHVKDLFAKPIWVSGYRAASQTGHRTAIASLGVG